MDQKLKELNDKIIVSLKQYINEFQKFNIYMEETYSQVADFLPVLENEISDKRNESKSVLDFMVSGVSGAGVANSIEDMGSIFKKNTGILDESIEKYSNIFRNIMSKLDSIQHLNKIIGQLKTKGIGIIISDHNVRETLSCCDRAYIVNEGAVLVEGAPEKIAQSELARKFYFGDSFNL